MIKLLLKIVCMVIIVGSANASEVDIKIGVLHFPPFYVISEKDGVSGIYTEILEKVLSKAGYSYSIDGFPPKRFYSQLGDNTTNLFIGVKGSKLIEGKVEFGDLKFEGIQLRAYSTNKNKVISKKEELVGKKLIVIRAFGYGGLVAYLKKPENNIQLIET
ncbi:MAG: hypothetical protein GQ470_00605, partial [Gammaproteobacteria bacterium]|nr:hypothetical protein [Gammaproteobacteria bacterium]